MERNYFVYTSQIVQNIKLSSGMSFKEMQRKTNIERTRLKQILKTKCWITDEELSIFDALFGTKIFTKSQIKNKEIQKRLENK